VNVNVSLSPHMGIVYKPFKTLRFTGTVHSPEKLVIGTNFTFLLSNGLEQGAAIQFAHAYMPWTFGLGTAWDAISVGDHTVTFAATITHTRWSSYVDRHDETPDPAYGWYDTFNAVVGARYSFHKVRTFLDLAYVPSPVPDQTGRTNYVDNDRVGASLGADYTVPFLGGKLRAGLQGQVHRLIPRDTYKSTDPNHPDGVIDEVPDNAVVNNQPLAGRTGLQTNNPGWPGFSSSGWIMGGGINVSFTQ
jgi:hypothetical protein